MSETILKESMGSSLRRWATSAGGITILLSVLVAFIAAIDAGPFVLVNAIVTGGMWALLSMGLSLVFGVMNIPNFAHGEFFLAGSLTAYFIFNPIRLYLRDNPSPFLSAFAPFLGIFAAIIVGMILGFLVEKVVFVQLRKRSREQWVMNSFLLTVGLSVIFVNSVQLIWGADFKGIPNYWDVDAINLFGVNLSVDRLAAFGLAAVTLAVFWYFMRRTQTGRAIRAVAQDETGALLVGINLNRILTLTMALSGGLAAMAGASLLFIFPAYPTAGLRPLYVAWYVVILVGLGNVSGAVVGGFIVALLQTLTSFYIGVGWEDVIPTAIIIVILIFRPSGLFGSEVKGIQEQ
ncbi:MAG: branched-chain amino acid ABC transporter permease [Ardenticatenaceae bacterium]|nr:branched-chain amino acid ABC transporter permease [Ardenticatenaceae bacterium]MCB9442917.1 branched-chain amino acid ABC transporter permease [Ardenticatenaceae bacterium]